MLFLLFLREGANLKFEPCIYIDKRVVLATEDVKALVKFCFE